MYYLILFTTALVSVNCDRFEDYQKFPNRRRYGEAAQGPYDYNKNVEYGRSDYNTYNNPSQPYNTRTAYTGQYDYNNGYNYGRNYCTNRSAQADIRMEQLMGMWYGVEFIPHLTGNPGTYRGDTCIVIHIAETTNEPSTESGVYHRAVLHTNWWREYRHLRLLWDEDGNDVEYSLYFKNDSVGFWNSHGDQNELTLSGTLPGRPSYKQFTGTVQVLKVVGNHLLLHFCQAPTDGNQAQLFSVLFSREPINLSRWEVDAAHDLLMRKKLSTTTRRLVCGNSADRNLFSALTLLIALASSLLRFMSL